MALSKMSSDISFRVLFILAAIAQFAIRVYYQSKVLPEQSKTRITGANWRLIPGAIATLTTLVFGAAFIFFPSGFPWSYGRFPDWIRWLGALMLLAGVSLLAAAHHHLGKSFHSLVVQKSGQVLVDSGPYRLIRHPIYTAYVLSYFGGGLLASSLVLTFVPAPLYILFIALRLAEEEAAMIGQFGPSYQDYMDKTGSFLPRLTALARLRRRS